MKPLVIQRFNRPALYLKITSTQLGTPLSQCWRVCDGYDQKTRFDLAGSSSKD